jgi:hypothetical protein
MPLSPELGRLKQEGCKFESSVGCVVRPCIKRKDFSKDKKQAKRNIKRAVGPRW